MTVSSLWKALDTADSAKPVGATQLADPSSFNSDGAHRKPQTLAVDLSIWICESFTAHGLSDTNTNPALHLVFARTMKLLKLGLNLIFVVEGKQRIRGNASKDLDNFRKRRSGTLFWKSCNECQHMLEMLGVPVVRATCEGEALCALLCDRGIVDGVLSNDGDCLLFGAKVVYTKFSNENLDNGRVMRYDLNSLYATVDATEDSDIKPSKAGTIKLSRTDLIAFAILTGSDLAGGGLENVGHKKAIRFIQKCQLDNPLSKETATLDEMKAWAKAATADIPQHAFATKAKEKCCSRCTHPGSKRSHEKHGCAMCGTAPGELCYVVTSDDHFRKSLREKALAMVPKFDPSKVRSTYMRPNENQLPLRIVTTMSAGIQMQPPKLGALLQSSLIVKGRSLHESRLFVRQAIARLLSSRELRQVETPVGIAVPDLLPHCRDRPIPIPIAIVKELTRNQEPFYEILWVLGATVSDDNGNGIDGFEYQTVEAQKLIERTHPHLIDSFNNEKAKHAEQGDRMQKKRREFLEMVGSRDIDHQVEANEKKRKGRSESQRVDFFQNQGPRLDVSSRNYRRKSYLCGTDGDDIGHLLRFACRRVQPSQSKARTRDDCDRVVLPTTNTGEQFLSTFNNPSTPNADKSLFCTMGGYAIEITPIASNRGAYPPNHIYVHFDSQNSP